MRRIYSTLSLVLLAVLFFQCQREVSHIGGPDNPIIEIPTPEPITAAIQGNVFDENGAPASGVLVQVGSKSATTNANGYFRINDAALDKKAALVTASKAGYFKSYRTFGATSGANNVEIKLVKKVLAGTINGTTGGEVSLTNGSKVALPANGVVNAATGAAYTGTVNVYANYIDPSASDISQTVPGSFMANDKDGRRVTLTSYGMIAVELESAAGEKLQVKSGSNATLTTAIPSSTQAAAPVTIALWSVDETTGIWKEEGTATKNGNVYVGNVSHFSFWNCDVSANALWLSMTLKNPDGVPLVRAHVKLKRAGTTWSVSGWTDSLGQVSGYIPYNQALIMEVVDQCNTPFYSQNIGPYTVNTNLGAITVTPTTSNSIVTVKGKLVNCSSQPVTNGYALVSLGFYTHYASVNAAGDFQTTFTRCGTSPANFSILGVDAGAQQQGTAPTSVAVVTPITTTGNISACGTSSSQFITYILDGTTYNLVSPPDSLTGFTSGQGTTQLFTSISGFSLNSSPNQISFSFQSPSQVAGSYNLNSIRVNNLDSNIIATPISVAITSFPTANPGFYEGSFSGQFTTNGTPHTISATFRVRRR